MSLINRVFQKSSEDWNAFKQRIGLGEIGIPYDSRDTYRAALGWMPDQGWLLIEGPAGVGKTALACAIVNDLLRQTQPLGKRLNALYETEDGIYQAIRMAKHLEPGQRNIANDARHVGVLILDDLGSVTDTAGWCRDVLQAIVMTRYDKRLPTIITTNARTEHLERVYGERTVSRILDSVGPMRLTLENPTWRNGAVTPARSHAGRRGAA